MEDASSGIVGTSGKPHHESSAARSSGGSLSTRARTAAWSSACSSTSLGSRLALQLVQRARVLSESRNEKRLMGRLYLVTLNHLDSTHWAGAGGGFVQKIL